MAIQNQPLRIPEQWDAAWFRTFMAEVLAKADVRNAVGVGLEITSNGNSVATLTVDAGTSLTPHNEDPLAHVAAFNAHKAESNPHAQYITEAPLDGNSYVRQNGAWVLGSGAAPVDSFLLEIGDDLLLEDGSLLLLE
jgi:plastocyanin